MTKSKQKQNLVQDQDKKPSEIELPDHIDLRPLYRSVQYVDEAGNPINPLRGIYETGDGGGKCPYAIKEYEGYRNFFKNTVWLTQADLLNFELSKEETDLVELNRRVLPLSKTSRKGEYSSLWGWDGEFDGPTKINHLLTPNQAEGFGRWGKVDGGCGENKITRGSPTYHPISFAPSYEYWDEGHYLKLFRLKEKSLDTYNLLDPLYSKCTNTMAKTQSEGDIKICELRGNNSLILRN